MAEKSALAAANLPIIWILGIYTLTLNINPVKAGGGGVHPLKKGLRDMYIRGGINASCISILDIVSVVKIPSRLVSNLLQKRCIRLICNVHCTIVQLYNARTKTLSVLP